jgi:hypothetical protein
MDARRNLSIGFLAIALLLVTVLASGPSECAQRGATYVETSADRCSGTRLRIQLDGIKPLPSEVLLKLRRASDDKEIANQPIPLNNDGRYYWSGLVTPLGKYWAQLFDAKDKTTPLGVAFAFNNIDILKDFVREERGEITYLSRGGNDTRNTQADLDRKSLTVNQLPSPTGHNQIHIVVIDDRATKADEYFGAPPSEHLWNTRPLLPGRYRLIVVEYVDNGTCKILKGR